MPASKHGDLYIASIEKAFRVFNAFDRARSELSLSELAQITSLTLPNIQRLTHTLTELGFLTRDSRTKRYSLTPRTLDIGFRYLEASPLLDRAAPHLAELNRRTEETVNMTVLDGTEIVYIARHRGFHSIGINMYIGARLPAFATSVGQVILAYLPAADANDRLAKSKRTSFTRNTITDRDLLVKKLRKIHQAGYALEDQEMFLGGISIAVPILDRDGMPLAAVNVAVPASRYTAAETERRFAKLVLETGRVISGPATHSTLIRPGLPARSG